MTTGLARPPRLDLETFSRAVGLHPDLVARLVRLGLLDAEIRVDHQLQFAPGQMTRAFRIQRLRAGLPLNYAALGLVMDLLDRIDQLEATLRRRPLSPRED